MSEIIKFEGLEYRLDSLSQEARQLALSLAEINKKIQELQNLQAIFLRAKNSYTLELKTEIVKEKSGVNLSDLFSD